MRRAVRPLSPGVDLRRFPRPWPSLVLGIACDASLAGGVENAREQVSVEWALRDQPDAEVIAATYQ